MKKRIFAGAMAAAMALTVTACGGSKPAASTAAPAASAAAPAASAAAPATSDYPKNPVTCIIPYAPGGGSDTLVRTMMKYLQLPNGANMVAVNVEGASGFTGCMQAYNSKPDGYNIMTHNHMDVLSYTLNGNTDQPLYADLTNICGIVDDFNVVVTNPATGWATIDDAVAYIHANPGTVKVGNTGSNNANMADCIRVLEALGVIDEVTIVPYDGGADNRTALMGGHVELSVNSCADIRAAIESGDHVALLTIGDRRAKFLPDTPCTKEAGYNIDTTKPRGFFGPANMDPAHVAVLQDAIQAVCENADFQAEIQSLGFEVNYVDGEDMEEKCSRWAEDYAPIFDQMLNG